MRAGSSGGVRGCWTIRRCERLAAEQVVDQAYASRLRAGKARAFGCSRLADQGGGEASEGLGTGGIWTAGCLSRSARCRAVSRHYTNAPSCAVALSLLPVAWTTAVMCKRDGDDYFPFSAVDQRVRKVWHAIDAGRFAFLSPASRLPRIASTPASNSDTNFRVTISFLFI